LTREEQERFDQTRACVACNKPFSDLDPKIMHHNHRTGKFIAALCNGCNLQIKNREDNFFVPVVFHNLKNYDVHHIFRHFSKSIAAKYDKKGKASYRSVKNNRLEFGKIYFVRDPASAIYRLVSVSQCEAGEIGEQSSEGLVAAHKEAYGR
jgi:hypothetical protein